MEDRSLGSADPDSAGQGLSIRRSPTTSNPLALEPCVEGFRDDGAAVLLACLSGLHDRSVPH